jgi:hypothetical protein
MLLKQCCDYYIVHTSLARHCKFEILDTVKTGSRKFCASPPWFRLAKITRPAQLDIAPVDPPTKFDRGQLLVDR